MLAALLLLTVGVDVSVQMLDGRVVDGGLESWTAAAMTVGGEKLPAADVARVEFPPDAAPAAEAAPVVRLRDGTAAVVAGFTRSGRDASAVGVFGEVLLPIDRVHAVRWTPAGERVAKQWDAIVEGVEGEDLFVVLRGGEPDRVACVLGDVTADGVSLRARGRDLTVPLAKVFGVVFAGGGGGEAAAFVTMADGSRLGCGGARLDGDELVLSRGDGDWRVPVDAVASVDLAAGRVTPLTSIEPARVAYDPFGANYDEFAWKLRVGRNAVGERLRLGGRAYEDGIWMHSGTTASFPLPADAGRFQATVGIDELETVGRPVRLTVLADGRELTSLTVEPEKPAAVDVDVSGRRELTLRAESTDRGGLGIREHLAVVAGRLVLQ